MSDQISQNQTSVLPVGDDVVLPFHVDGLDVRGRTIHLGPMLDEMFSRHNYPVAVSSLLGEVIVLTVLLGTSLKFDGKFIVQTQSDGPVSLLVVDFATPDSVRAYAQYDAQAVQQVMDAENYKASDLLGKGALGLTVDQGAGMQRYQGIVALDGQSLEEVAMQYFRQSEQIPTQVRLATAQVLTPNENGTGALKHWRAGGVLTQFLPDAPDRIQVRDLPGGDPNEEEPLSEDDDAWNEAKILTASVRDDELTDPMIGAEQLLYRLFHEHGVRAYAGVAVRDNCSCSREKVIEMIRGFDDDLSHDGPNDEPFETTCEFCSKTYVISKEEINV